MLAHEHVRTEITCPGPKNVTQALINKGPPLTEKHTTSDTLRGIDALTGVDYLSHFINGKPKYLGVHVFLSFGGLIPFGLLPKWLRHAKLFPAREKVAPIKRVFLPRLKLLGTLFCPGLIEFVRSAIRLPKEVSLFFGQILLLCYLG